MGFWETEELKVKLIYIIIFSFCEGRGGEGQGDAACNKKQNQHYLGCRLWGKLCCHGGLCARVLRECMAVVVPYKS